MPAWSRLLLLVSCVACGAERSEADTAQSAQSAEPADCPATVERAQQAGADSLFRDARGLIARCPDAMALRLSAIWSEPAVSPARARTLRAVSALLRDQRLVQAIESAVRDAARPIETRVEALSTMSYYLQAGRWIEFTFLKDDPDSASLRMFMGVMENPTVTTGAQPIPADYGTRFRGMLENLRDADSSSAVRSAARRFLVFLDYARQEQQKTPPASAPPPAR
jgi:hypothetical protein